MSGSIKMAQRDVINSYRKVYWVGYCGLQHLFTYMDPIGKNTGIYGWNCDFYLFPERDTAIVTGYRFRYNVPHMSHDLCSRYDKKAEEIIRGAGNYEIKREALNILLDELIEEFEKSIKK